MQAMLSWNIGVDEGCASFYLPLSSGFETAQLGDVQPTDTMDLAAEV